MNIAIILPDNMKFVSSDIWKKPLGGAQQSTVGLAEVLVRFGHRVSIFNTGMDIKENGVDNVRYLSGLNKVDFDVFILNFAVLWEAVEKIDLERTVLWSHNTIFFFNPEFLKRVPFVICAGKSQRIELEKAGLSHGQGLVIDYGINCKDFPSIHRNEKRIIFTGVPDRGVECLLSMVDSLVSIESEIEIMICSDWGLYFPERKHEQFGFECDEKLKHPNLKFVGSVHRRELIDYLASSYIFVYPCSWPYHTFCCSILEAQAAGLPVVTTNLGGLKDGAREQILVDEIHFDNSVFISEVESLLKDKTYWNYFHNRALAFSRQHDWKNIVKEWEELFNKLC